MAAKKLLIITGITGFVGSHLVNSNFLKDYDVVGLSSDKFFTIFGKIEEITKSQYLDKIESASKIKIIFLATYYSLNNEEKDLITEANENFGKNFLLEINNTKIEKIVYTNSVFIFSNNMSLKNSIYTKTKINFSNYLKNFAYQYSISYSEIVLSNNFGSNDERKKLIPEIITSIKLNNLNPTNNPNKYINLLPIDTICKSLIDELDAPSRKVYLKSKKDYKILSIYNFCKNLINNNVFGEIEYAYESESLNIPLNVEIIKLDFNLENELFKLIKKQ